jgi:4-hydroxy-4-methyl-2-oxoglutarate aldolase
MAIQRYEISHRRLGDEELAAWGEIPPPIASDCMNRTQSMAAAIKPVKPGLKLVGQARTVTCMVADSGVVHVATARLKRNDVLVIDNAGFEDVACWGGNATRCAMSLGGAGLVIDGSIRDVAEIRESGWPVFCRNAVPRGPHKGFGGVIDGIASVGGVAVRPGDIVLGDDDGVVVVPLAQADGVLAAARALLAKESGWLEAMAEGKTMAEILGLKEDEILLP